MKKPAISVISATTAKRWLAARQLSTALEASDPAATERGPKDDHWRLLRRLWTKEAKEAKSIDKILQVSVAKGNSPPKLGLVSCIKELRKNGRFHHALQVSEWMERNGMSVGSADHAVRLDLISRAKGIGAAEEHFERLPEGVKDYMTYGSLLSCYCNQLVEEKAVALFRKMDENGLLKSALPFTNVMTMHLKLGQPEKVFGLVEEMKRKNVSLDSYAYNIWMQSHGHLNDIDSVERVLEEMKDRDWTTYNNLASIYIKAGHFEKAESALKKLEAEMDPSNRSAYHFLITFYAATSNLTEVRRVWKLLKSRFRTTHNASYHCLVPALSKLNDMDGVRKWFKDWESSSCKYNVGIVNAVLKAYLDHDMYDEAIKVFEGAKKKSGHKLFKAPEMFIRFLLKWGRVDSALKHLKEAISESEGVRSKFRLEQETVDSIFKCFEEEKDAGKAEEFYKMLKNLKLMDLNAYCQLLKVYTASGKVDPEMRKRLEEDKIELSSEVESFLDKVCPM